MIFASAIAGYVMSPIDLNPDFIPVIGLTDDAILIPAGIWLFRKLVPPYIFQRNLSLAQAASRLPVSKIAAAAIILLWLGLALWLAHLLGSTRYF